MTSGLSGSLSSSDVGLPRDRTLVYSASDQGGGIFRERLIVDGAVVVTQTVNDNAGKCVLPFRDPVPCRTSSTSSSIDLNTATLADGQHTLKLEVRDATDVNKVQTAPWTILVDNLAPSVGVVQVTGTPREGDTLTCSATATGQSPALTYAWVRANPDGSNQIVIPGATGATYGQQTADIGSKLLCRVAAADHGGTTTRDSTVTSGPFADGATVAAYCTARPTGPADDCGDLDGDGADNRTDSDDDNDGVPDTSDIAPLDPAIPAVASGSTGGSGGAGGNGAPGASTASATSSLVATDLNTIGRLRNPISEAVGNGTPISHDALLAARFAIGSGSALRTSTRTVVAYAQALRVRGTLQTPANRPIVAARVYLVQKPLGASDAAWRLDKTTLTGADGSFTLPVTGNGRSREIRVVYFPVGGSDANRGSNPLTLQVRQDATFAVSKRRLRNRQTLTFRGQVLGTVPTAGVDVRVQVRLNRSWFTFTKFTTTRSKGGRFRVSHRFTKTTSPTTYRFRVLVLPRNRKVYTTGFSRHIDVRVLP